MTCNECLYYDGCRSILKFFIPDIFKQDCKNLKNKTNLVKLPCENVEEVKHRDKWISVKDRLPKPDEHVLCYHRYEPDSPDVICENLYQGSGLWLSEGSTVTHWMHLPEPPKERGEEIK